MSLSTAELVEPGVTEFLHSYIAFRILLPFRLALIFMFFIIFTADSVFHSIYDGEGWFLYVLFPILA